MDSEESDSDANAPVEDMQERLSLVPGRKAASRGPRWIL